MHRLGPQDNRRRGPYGNCTMRKRGTSSPFPASLRKRQTVPLKADKLFHRHGGQEPVLRPRSTRPPQATVTVDEVAVQQRREAARRPRKVRKHHWVLEAAHYLELLRNRPEPSGTPPFRNGRKTWSSSLNSLLNGSRERQGETGNQGIIDVCSYQELRQKRVEDAVKGPGNDWANAAEIRHLLESSEREEETSPPESERWTSSRRGRIGLFRLEAGNAPGLCSFTKPEEPYSAMPPAP